MLRAIGAPEKGDGRTRPAARFATLGCVAVLYSSYPAAVCAAIAAGQPRLALAATCVALGVYCTITSRWRRVGIGLLVAAPLVALSATADFVRPLVFVPPVALNLGLAALFARSLNAGREPLISTFARAERGTLEPDLARYTRTLTVLWVAFFVGAAAASALLAIFATPASWGWFVGAGNYAAVALFVVGEYLFRRVRFRQYRHASPLALAAIVASRWRLSGSRR
jgi:uncharacterized membrane protein